MKSIDAFSQTVEAFLAFIRENTITDENIGDLIGFLMKLYVAATELPETEPEDIEEDFTDFEPITARFSDRIPLVYQEIFHPFRDSHPESHSLRYDLEVIIGDLQHGLEAYRKGYIRAAVQIWNVSFHTHWGQHIVDALKALHELRREYSIPDIRRWKEGSFKLSGDAHRARLKCIKVGMPALVLGRIYDAYIGFDLINGVEIVGILDVDGDGEEFAFPAKWFEVVEILK